MQLQDFGKTGCGSPAAVQEEPPVTHSGSDPDSVPVEEEITEAELASGQDEFETENIYQSLDEADKAAWDRPVKPA